MVTAFISHNPNLHALRFSMLPYKQQDRITNIPLYACECIGTF